MCGIAGILNPSLPVDENLFPSMLETLYPRGPDEKGTYVDPNVILGSRRLSIIDLEHGKQPLSSWDDSVWVVLNGEIYNYNELRYGLEKKGYRFKTKTDTEVLIHLYLDEGERFVEKLRGMFAFALYDKRKGDLFLARDRVGKKPLFYTQTGKKLLFGSEIKCLLKHPEVHRNPNYTALYHYFTFRHIPRPLTAFEGIFSLLPGEMLRINRQGEMKKSTYWSVSFDPTSIQEDEALKILDDKLREAVKLRVYSSDVPVGTFLSGGLDSSLIAALMREYSGGELHSFSLVYEEEENPDAPFARMMAEKLGTTHHEYILKTDEITPALPGIVKAFDEPFGGVISTYFLSKLIAQHVKVALSGDGADELFGSYANHRLAWPIYYYLKGDKAWENWLGENEKVQAIADSDPGVWRMKLYPFNDELKRSLFSPQFLSHLNGTSTSSLVEKQFQEIRSSDPLNRVLGVDFHHLLPDEVLTYVDRLSMAQSLEVRSPFLDQEVVTFAASLPGKMKINPSGTKQILRKLASRYLPTSIIERPKKGFILPFHKWLLGSLGSYTREAMSPRNLKRSGLLKAEPIIGLMEKQQKGEKDYTYGLFSILMFQLWWETYFS